LAAQSSRHAGPLAGIEGRLPPEMADKAEADGVAKAGQGALTLVALGILGGAFVAFGAIFSNVALAGAAGVAPYGLARVISGFVFALGLSLILLGSVDLHRRRSDRDSSQTLAT
jgi:formate transporter